MCTRFDVHTHVFPSCMHICAQIFTKNYLLVPFSVMSLRLKFHKDPLFCCGDIWKMERGFFLATTVHTKSYVHTWPLTSLKVSCGVGGCGIERHFSVQLWDIVLVFRTFPSLTKSYRDPSIVYNAKVHYLRRIKR